MMINRIKIIFMITYHINPNYNKILFILMQNILEIYLNLMYTQYMVICNNITLINICYNGLKNLYHLLFLNLHFQVQENMGVI